MKIIMNPGAGDHSGCPFRGWAEPSMRLKMQQKRFTPPQCDEIIALMKGQHYQIACQRYYAYSHNGVMAEQVGTHPNVYFDASEQYFREQQAGTGTGGATPAAGASGAPAAASQAASSTEYNAFASGAARAAPAGATTSGPATAAASATPAATTSAPSADSAAASSGPAPMDMADDAAAAASS
jgi:DNA primase large subunit